MINRIVRLAVAAALLAAPAYAQKETAEQQAFIAKMKELQSSLHPVDGDIAISEAEAVLHLGRNYYFLPAAEARRVIVEAWGNPPGSADGVLGMVFPAGKTFADDTWGAVISFEKSGYVSDKDAASTDYQALLADLQSSEAAENDQRKELGYPAVHLVGWAQAPVYDARTHSVVWARNIKFEGTPENTLNYDVRLLGRHGVLSLNMVTSMPKLEETRQAAATFARSADFRAGARYADYQPGVDAEAGYGIAGLVAAGAGAAAAKKVGLFALILAFGKKFIFLIIAAGVGIAAWLRRRFGSVQEDQNYSYYQEEPLDEVQAEPTAADPASAVADAPGEPSRT